VSGDFPEYQERVGSFSDGYDFEGWHLKLYTIDSGGRTRPEASLEAALARIPELLPERTQETHGEAFAILHAGADAIWLLVHWWTDTCLLHHRMVAAPLDTPHAFTLTVPETLIACSWELAIVQFERDAWVRTVQGAGPEASFEAYRSDVMPPTDI
jgi:hypothetical protein